MQLNGILHDRACWPTNTKEGLLTVKAAKTLPIKVGAVVDIPVGFSISIPKSKCLYAVSIVKGLAIASTFILDGERVTVSIENQSDKDIELKRGDSFAKLIMLNYDDIQFVPETIG